MKGIYKITNKKNNRKYIGQSKDIFVRLNKHIHDLKNNSHYNKKMQDDFNKYGYHQFIFEIIEICENNISEVEKKYIKELKETDYNILCLEKKKTNIIIYKNENKKGIAEISESSKSSLFLKIKTLNIKTGSYKFISHNEGDKIIIELEKIFKEEAET